MAITQNAAMQTCVERCAKWHVPAVCCTVYFSVDLWWRALTCRFLPAPINYWAVAVPLRWIISALDRYNNEPGALPLWDPILKTLKSSLWKRRIELCLVSHSYHEFNAFWDKNQWFVKSRWSIIVNSAEMKLHRVIEHTRHNRSFCDNHKPFYQKTLLNKSGFNPYIFLRIYSAETDSYP